MKVSVIIVHYKTPESLQKLQKLLKNSENQIIVIDNSVRNIGYAAGCNKGALEAKHEWLLFVNPDVEIDGSQIDKLVNYAVEQKLDACSPYVGENYQKSLPTWHSLLIEFSPLKLLYGLYKLSTLKTLFGGCLLIKKEILFKLGGWDERFFVWFEDSDLTKRLIENGYMVGWLDGLDIKHRGGESLKKLDEQTRADIFFHSMDVFARKHFSKLGQLVIRLLKKKHSTRNALPKINDRVNITVPNLKLELLKSFFQENEAQLSSMDELIVVSSAIGSEEVWDWRRKYPNVRFIPIEQNHGFATTANIGFRASAGEWVGTVNDDVRMSENWIEKCLKCVNENTGSLNPLIYADNKTIESAGIKILLKGKAETIKDVPKTCLEVEATNGAAVLYSKGAINAVGLFDERFGSYLEDIDLSLRLKNKGYKNIVSPSTKIFHAGHQTSKNFGTKKAFLDFKNWFLVIAKNWSTKDLLLNLPIIVIERFRNLSGIIKSMR